MTRAALTCNAGWLLLRNGCVSPKRKLLSSFLSGWKNREYGEDSGQEAFPTWAKSLELWKNSKTAQVAWGDMTCGQQHALAETSICYLIWTNYSFK